MSKEPRNKVRETRSGLIVEDFNTEILAKHEEGIKLLIKIFYQKKVLVPPKCEFCKEPCGHDWCPVKDKK